MSSYDTRVRDFLALEPSEWYYQGHLTSVERWQKAMESDRLFLQSEIVCFKKYIYILKYFITRLHKQGLKKLGVGGGVCSIKIHC